MEIVIGFHGDESEGGMARYDALWQFNDIIIHR